VDEVFEQITRRLEHTQQEYKIAKNQQDYLRLQQQSVSDLLEDLEDEIDEYTKFLKNYEKNKGQA
jgi:chromosome segregation ATPase